MRPILSIVIATFNSEKTLSLVLSSIRNQIYPQNKIEIILVDGGSEDNTLSIAQKYQCRIVKNLRTEPVFGKFLGLLEARGRFVMYLDHDEVLKNRLSLSKRISALESGYEVKVIAGGNYVTPRQYPFITTYINEFGDPFSYFIFKISKRFGFYIPTMRKRYRTLEETKDYIIFDLSGVKKLPLTELVSGGAMFDRLNLAKEFPIFFKDWRLLPHIFYFLIRKYPYLLIIKDDPIFHYSSDSLWGYINKIKWRVKNNVFFGGDLKEAGFMGRLKVDRSISFFKAFLFLPYSTSLILPFLDGLSLSISRKDIKFLVHAPLCLITAFLISYFYLLKIFGYRPKLRSYDESKIIPI